MSLPIWLASGAVVAVLVWRLRIASTALRAILAEPLKTETAADPRPDGADTGDGGGRTRRAEPPAIAWPHPPGRLWVR